MCNPWGESSTLILQLLAGTRRWHWDKGKEAGIHPGCTEPPPRALPGTSHASVQSLIFWGDFQFLMSLFWVIHHFITHRYFNFVFISHQWSHSKLYHQTSSRKQRSPPKPFPPHLLFPFSLLTAWRAEPKLIHFPGINQAENQGNVQSHGRRRRREGREGNYAALWLGLGWNPPASSSGKEHGENGVAFQPLLAEAANTKFRPGFCSPALLNGLQLH